jgi:flagellar protein FliS
MSTYSAPASTLSGSARGAMAYRTVGAQSSSPLELVVMLYDGAIRFLQEARDAHDRKDMWGRARGTSKALAIVAELHNTLNVEDGARVAADLDRLYTYMMGRLLDVTMKRDASALEEVQRLLGTVRDGWVQVSAASPPRP